MGWTAAAPARQKAASVALSCAAAKNASPSASAVGFPPQAKNACGVFESSRATAATVRAEGTRIHCSKAESPYQNTRYEAAAASNPARAGPNGQKNATSVEKPRGYAPACTEGQAGERTP